MFKNLPVSFDNNILVFPTKYEIRLESDFFSQYNAKFKYGIF